MAGTWQPRHRALYSTGVRFPDLVAGAILRELKDGYVVLSKLIRSQIAKEFYLKQIRGFLPEWHFFGGVSQPVLQELDRLGIPYFIH